MNLALNNPKCWYAIETKKPDLDKLVVNEKKKR